MDWARMARARSSASAAMRPTLTPGAGATSNWVTTGPVVRPTILPSTRNVARVSISTWPSRSNSASPASAWALGGASSSMGGSASASSPSIPPLAADVRLRCPVLESQLLAWPDHWRPGSSPAPASALATPAAASDSLASATRAGDSSSDAPGCEACAPSEDPAPAAPGPASSRLRGYQSRVSRVRPDIASSQTMIPPAVPTSEVKPWATQAPSKPAER